jgi:hypothetical protein
MTIEPTKFGRINDVCEKIKPQTLSLIYEFLEKYGVIELRKVRFSVVRVLIILENIIMNSEKKTIYYLENTKLFTILQNIMKDNDVFLGRVLKIFLVISNHVRIKSSRQNKFITNLFLSNEILNYFESLIKERSIYLNGNNNEVEEGIKLEKDEKNNDEKNDEKNDNEKTNFEKYYIFYYIYQIYIELLTNQR